MAQASYQQTNFLGGEFSKFAQGLTDKPNYRTGMNVCLNGFPNETGTWVRRPGSQFLATTFNGLPARLIPFEFKRSAPYMMEFANGTLRFYSGASPLSLATTDLGRTVVSISTTSPPVITTATPHLWSTNDQVQLIGTNVKELQNRQLFITVLSATTFSIFDPFETLDGSTFTPFVIGGIARVTVIATNYLTAMLPDLRAVQTERRSVLLHPDLSPRILSVVSEPAPPASAVFALSAAQFIDGPYLDPTPGSTMTPSAVSGAVTLTQTGPLVNDGAGFTAADIGRLVRVFSEPPIWPGPATGLAGDIVTYGGGYWVQQVNATVAAPGTIGSFPQPLQGVAIAGSGSSIGGVAPPTTVAPQWLPLTVTAAASWCWGAITAVGGLQTITVLFNRVLVSTAKINTWRLGVYGGPNGWPSCGTYADGRLWLAGAIPNRIDASNSNDIFNFTPTLGDGTVLDSHGISAIFNSDGSNQIFWMQQDQQGIICGTQAGEWLVFSTAAGFSPSNIAVRRVTKIGCANIEPRRTDHTLVGVQAFKREVFEYFADVYSGKFSAPDISSIWKHLTKGGLQEIAYQQEIVPIVWARVNNGLVGCTYKRDTLASSQGPNIAAGHRHLLGSGRTIESIAVGGSAGGTLDALYMVTFDSSTGFRHVEILTNILDEGASLIAAAYLDNAFSPASVIPTSPDLSLPYGGIILTGLHYLNGKSVTAWIAGLDCGDYLVANGQITVPYGDGISAGTANGLFTADIVALYGNALPRLVGFPFESRGQIVRPSTPAESGARNGPAFGKKRRNHQYAVQVEGTQGISIGVNFADMQPAIFRNPDNSVIAQNVLFTGIHVDSVNDDYSYDGMLCWRITRPYPCNMVAIGGFLETMDK